ncbi:MAG: AAA family ATPase [Coriobacteriia bacterium]
MSPIVAVGEERLLGGPVRAAAGRLRDPSVYLAGDLPAAETLMNQYRPEVLVIGQGVAPTAALEFAQGALERRPSTAIVLIAHGVGEELLRAALRMGLVDVIAADALPAELAQALERASEHAVRLGAGTDMRAAATASHGAKVVTVFSTKGGVGKTVIATNVAVALASELKQSVILVDLDLQFGDTGIVLDLPPDRTIFDAVQVYDRLDGEMLRGFLTDHKSGLKVLLAPVRPEDADALTASRLGAILDLIAGLADYVVIDTAAAFDDVVLTAIDKSDEVYAVATMDVASVKNTRVSLQKLAQMGYDGSLVRLVLNRADSKVLLEPAEVQRTLGGEVVAEIPSDRLVPRSVNRGVPVVLDSPRSQVTKHLIRLAKLVATRREEATRDDAQGAPGAGE